MSEKWRPITSAPKDATPIDIWRPSWGGERCVNMRRVNLGRGNVFYEPVESGPCCVRDATHWMPIPSAPQVDDGIVTNDPWLMPDPPRPFGLDGSPIKVNHE